MNDARETPRITHQSVRPPLWPISHKSSAIEHFYFGTDSERRHRGERHARRRGADACLAGQYSKSQPRRAHRGRRAGIGSRSRRASCRSDLDPLRARHARASPQAPGARPRAGGDRRLHRGFVPLRFRLGRILARRLRVRPGARRDRRYRARHGRLPHRLGRLLLRVRPVRHWPHARPLAAPTAGREQLRGPSRTCRRPPSGDDRGDGHPAHRELSRRCGGTGRGRGRLPRSQVPTGQGLARPLSSRARLRTTSRGGILPGGSSGRLAGGACDLGSAGRPARHHGCTQAPVPGQIRRIVPDHPRAGDRLERRGVAGLGIAGVPGAGRVQTTWKSGPTARPSCRPGGRATTAL